MSEVGQFSPEQFASNFINQVNQFNNYCQFSMLLASIYMRMCCSVDGLLHVD